MYRRFFNGMAVIFICAVMVLGATAVQAEASITAKLLKSAAKSAAKKTLSYADDAAKAASKYCDDAAKIVIREGDDAAKLMMKHTHKAADTVVKTLPKVVSQNDTVDNLVKSAIKKRMPDPGTILAGGAAAAATTYAYQTGKGEREATVERSEGYSKALNETAKSHPEILKDFDGKNIVYGLFGGVADAATRGCHVLFIGGAFIILIIMGRKFLRGRHKNNGQ